MSSMGNCRAHNLVWLGHAVRGQGSLYESASGFGCERESVRAEDSVLHALTFTKQVISQALVSDQRYIAYYHLYQSTRCHRTRKMQIHVDHRLLIKTRTRNDNCYCAGPARPYHTIYLIYLLYARPKLDSMEPAAINLHGIFRACRRCLGHLRRKRDLRGHPGRHERDFRRRREGLWDRRHRRLLRLVGAMHVFELPHFPAMFVTLFTLASFANVEI